MCAVVEFFCCAPPFLLFCCPRPSLRLHSLLTSMASPPTYGSQCTPSLARASCIRVLSESLHCFMRICFDCHLAARLEICSLKFISDLPTEIHMHAQCESRARQLYWVLIWGAAHFWHESHSAQFSSTSSVVVLFFFFFLLISAAWHCHCAQKPPCCQNPAAFSLLSSVRLHPHLGQASVRKRSFAPMLLPKVWGFCRAGWPHCDSAMTSAIHPLISSPEPPKPHISVVIDARCRFPKFQMFEFGWPQASSLRQPRGGKPSHWKRWIRNAKILRFFHVFCYVWYKYLNFWLEYWYFIFQSMKLPLSILFIFKWRRLAPWRFAK